jgi:CheY-like chemotaxis protein
VSSATLHDRRSVNVLLVEDNPGDVRLIQKAVEAWPTPVELRIAGDGEEALEALRRDRPPDLILLDLNLPKLDGRELLARLKGNPKLRQIPVLILTSSTNHGDILTTYQLHANCYLSKPVGFEELAATLRAVHDFWLTVVRLPGRLT